MTQKLFQTSLFPMKNKNAFGGALLKKSHPKEKRNISTKKPMHIVIRSSFAKGRYSFLHKNNKKMIDSIIQIQSKKWGIRLYRFENVGNHIHFLLKIHNRRQLNGFLRSVTGLIPRKILGCEKGMPLQKSFWDLRPFSRIISWGIEYKVIQKYFDKNQLEAIGFNLQQFVKIQLTLNST